MKHPLPLRNLILSCILMITFGTVFSQSPFVSTGRSGSLTVSGTQTVNSYYHVTAISGNSVTCTGFSPAAGDRVLLIQMTGTYAGNWQWDTVVTGGNPFTVYAFSSPTLDPVGGIVQAITVPQYSNLMIPAGATLTASPWNGTTGGILTFMVQHRFTVQSGGKCDVSGLGWSGSNGAIGGAGGVGGTAGGIGLPGGDSLQVLGSGLGGGGNGGLYGADATPGGAPALTICPDCGAAPDSGGTNLSTVNPSFGGFTATSLMLGGAGQGGAGGHGGIGAGGGGGGTAAAGTAGGFGGAGGNAGNGGKGAGIILFSADSLIMSASGFAFVADGLNGTAATNGGAGNPGGDGGDGLTPCNAGGGGGGGGGGNGGGGGGGGGGGDILALLQHACANLTLSTVQASGGTGGGRGTGGAGGLGGINGGPVNSTCSGSTAPATTAPVGPPGSPGTQGGNGNDGPAGGGGTGTQGGGLGIFISDCSTNPITASYPYSWIGDNCGQGFDPNQLQISGGDGNYNVSFNGVNLGCGSQGVGGYGSIEANYVTITDGSGCSGQFVFNLTYVDDLFDFYVLSQTNTSCPNASDGSITLQVTDIAPAECNPTIGYTISGQATGYYNSGTTGTAGIVTLTGLPADNYTYTISGQDQCSQATNGFFVISSNNTPVSGTENVTICYGTSYLWNGSNYTQSGNYTTTLTGASAAGCDSIDNLNLTVETQITATGLGQLFGDGCGIYYDNTQVSPSGGQPPYNISSNPNGPGNCIMSPPCYLQPYSITVTDGNQCSATFNGSAQYNDDQFDFIYSSSTNASCQNASDGTYTGTTANLSNLQCAVGWTLTISGSTVSYNFQTTGTVVGGTVTVPGLAPGTYTYSIIGGGLCSPNTTGTFTIGANTSAVNGSPELDTVCYGGSFTWHGTVYTQTGTYTDTLHGASAGGCDSIAHMHLTILSQIVNYGSNNQGESAGCNLSYDPNLLLPQLQGGYGNYTVANFIQGPLLYSHGAIASQYEDTVYVVDGFGCQAVFDGSFFINEAPFQLRIDSVLNAACGGTGRLVFDVNCGVNTLCSTQWAYYISGPAGYHYSDSIYITNALPDTFLSLGGLASGTYTYQVFSGAFDALTDTGSFTIGTTISANSGQVYDTICTGSPFTWGGNTYTQSGTFADTLHGAGAGGCDSIAILHLTAYPASSVNLYDTLITGDTLHVGGYVHYQSGIYYDTLSTVHGCDSALTVYLYVASSATFAHLFDTVCQGFAVVLGGHRYTVSGTYIDTMRGYLGGDSIVTLNLTVGSAILSNVYDTICQGSAYTVGGHSYTQSGIYVDTLTSPRGCDSIRALHLTVAQYINPTASITVSHGPVIGGMQTDTFTASATDCAAPYYTWFENITPLGLHTAVITVTRSQGQADSITCRVYCHDACSSSPYVTTNSIIYTGIGDVTSSVSGVNIYPNPTQGSFNMDIEVSTAADQNADITITDLVGQSILSRSMTLHSGSNKQLLTLGDGTASGIYIIQLNVEGQSMYFRIVLDK